MSIELIVLDVDGTLTQSKVTYTQNGDEIKSFSVRDGLAIESWVRLGKKAAIITGRNSKMVERRAKELGIKYFYQGCKDKLLQLQKLCDELDLSLENVAAIGDDLNDYKMLKAAGLSFAPYDASHYLFDIVSVKLGKSGGQGAVREMIEYLLKQEGLEEKFLELWR